MYAQFAQRIHPLPGNRTIKSKPLGPEDLIGKKCYWKNCSDYVCYPETIVDSDRDFLIGRMVDVRTGKVHRGCGWYLSALSLEPWT